MTCIVNIVRYKFYHHLQLKIQQMCQSPELKYNPLSDSKMCLKSGNRTIILVYTVICKLSKPV